MANLTRHEKREIVFQLLYEAEYHQDKTAGEIYSLAVSERAIPADSYIEKTFLGVRFVTPELDEKIVSYARNWKIDRMSTVARSVLRLAVFELTHTDTPPRVVINEAVEITKTYDVAESAAFVNGILNNLARESGYLKDDASSVSDV